MEPMPGLDSDQIRHAILTAQAKGYRQVRVRLGEDRFSAVLSAPVASEPEDEEEPEAALDLPAPSTEKLVASPSVGYYRAVGDLKVGDRVGEGDKVGEVVALGLANDVTADVPGEVKEVCVADGDAVEFGQRILVLKP
jgi:biotin carboxyl carrier protein